MYTFSSCDKVLRLSYFVCFWRICHFRFSIIVISIFVLPPIRSVPSQGFADQVLMVAR